MRLFWDMRAADVGDIDLRSARFLDFQKKIRCAVRAVQWTQIDNLRKTNQAFDAMAWRAEQRSAKAECPLNISLHHNVAFEIWEKSVKAVEAFYKDLSLDGLWGAKTKNDCLRLGSTVAAVFAPGIAAGIDTPL